MGRRQLCHSSDSAKGIRCERILVQIAVGFQIRRSTPIVNLEKIDVLKIDFKTDDRPMFRKARCDVAKMSEFDFWFLLTYTVYTVASVLGLMWVGRDR